MLQDKSTGQRIAIDGIILIPFFLYFLFNEYIFQKSVTLFPLPFFFLEFLHPQLLQNSSMKL